MGPARLPHLVAAAALTWPLLGWAPPDPTAQQGRQAGRPIPIHPISHARKASAGTTRNGGGDPSNYSNHVAAPYTRRRPPRRRFLNAAAASVQPLVRGPQLRLCVVAPFRHRFHRGSGDLILSRLLPQPWGSATASTAAWDGAAATGRSPATTSMPAAATTTTASTRKVNSLCF